MLQNMFMNSRDSVQTPSLFMPASLGFSHGVDGNESICQSFPSAQRAQHFVREYFAAKRRVINLKLSKLHC